MTEKAQSLINTITDGVLDLLVYNRKNDEELSVEDVERLLESGEVTLAQLTKAFQDSVRDNFPEIKES